jgi:DNA-binding MarR family transcriptional regulator
MTAQGRELLNELIPLVASVQRDILAPLAEEDRPVFMRLLRTLLGFEERAVQ